MEYDNNEVLFDFFKGEITHMGSLRIKGLEKEITALKKRELDKINNEIEENINRFLNVELRSLKSDHSSEINKINNKNRRLLMQKRQDLIEGVFNDVIKKISDFVKTKDYLFLMELKLKKSVDLLKSTDTIITYNQNDEMLKKVLMQTEFKNFKTKLSSEIKLGGFIASSVKKSIEINETLDVRLEEKKQWFFENSNLFIRN